MAYEHKEGQGSLFKNEKQNDRQPDYKGTIVINGTTYEVAAWERTSQRGSQYLSLQAGLPKERDARQAGAGQRGQDRPQPQYDRQAPMPSADDMPDFGQAEDLPF